jgi:hypothetical protein
MADEEDYYSYFPAYTDDRTGQIYESIMFKGQRTFLTYKSGAFITQDELYADSGKAIKPLEKSLYKEYEFDELPSKVPTTSELYDEVFKEFSSFVYIDEESKHILTATCLLSYHQDLTVKVPYVDLFGPPESGKSCVDTIVSWLGYRTFGSVEVTSANIYRYLGKFQNPVVGGNPGVIIEDELEDLEKDKNKLGIYRSGYSNDGTVERYSKSFPTYGIKIFSGINPIKDEALSSRTITIHMVKGAPLKDLDDVLALNPKYFFPLRNKLLAWRVAKVVTRESFNSVDPSTPVGQFLQSTEAGRLKQIWGPLLRMSLKLSGEEPIGQALYKDYKNTHRSRADSSKGYIARVLKSQYLDTPKTKIEFSTIWEQLSLQDGVEQSGEVDQYGLPTKLIMPDQTALSRIKLAEILISWGGTRARGKEVCYRFNKEKLANELEPYLHWEKIKKDADE